MGSYSNVDTLDFITVLEHAASGTIQFSQVSDAGDDRILRISEALIRKWRPGIGQCKMLMMVEAGREANFDIEELTYLTDQLSLLYGEEVELNFGHGINDSPAFPQDQLKVSLLVAYDGKF